MKTACVTKQLLIPGVGGRMPSWIWDFFAGGGGASRGIELATGRSPDYAINHSEQALEMHAANHPGTMHLKEDVFSVDLGSLYEGDVGLAWFSPDCTHFSKAKGSKPRSQKVRGLAFVALKVGAMRRPSVMILENVQEFLTWGPLRQRQDAQGRKIICEDGSPWLEPDPDRSGETFRAFVAGLTTGIDPAHPVWDEIRADLGPKFPYEALQRGLGYQIDWRVLDAADYGAPTHRRRLVLVARCDGHPVQWPQRTHGPGCPHPFKQADACIDWSDLGTSIFERRRPLAEDTCKRIAKGVMRYVVEAAQGPYVVPLLTVPEHQDQGDLVAAWIAKHYGGPRGPVGHRPDRPLGTITARDHHSVVTVHLKRAQEHQDLESGSTAIVAAFLTKYYGVGSYAQAVDSPLHTIRAKACFGLVTVFVDGVTYAITDIRMRMIKPRELARCQGFDEDYVLVGSKQDQIARIGNSVPPPLARAVVAANVIEKITKDAA